jgi:hypothetical protein
MMNPFEYGRELGTNELVDREKEVAAVSRANDGSSLLSKS